MKLNKSTVEDTACEWFGELGDAIGHGPHMAPGELRVKACEPYVAEATP